MNLSQRRRSEAGVTLIEMLFVIAIVSALVLFFATGLLTSATVANNTNDKQRLNLAVTSMGETLRQVGYYESTGTGCTSAATAAEYLGRYTALDPSLKSGTRNMTVEILSVTFWSPVPLPTSTTIADQWSGTCRNQAGAQKIKFRVTLPGATPGGRGSMTGELVKRRPV